MDAVTEYGAQWWLSEIEKAETRLRQDWWTNADKIVKRYKAKRQNDNSKTYLLNIFWANVGVLKAALYARTPKPMVNRVWSDMNDNIGRVAALILERCLSFDLMKNNSPMDMSIKMAVEDRLIPGLGLCWMRYEMEEETVSVPGAPGGDPVSFQVIAEECAPCDYVQWRDVIFPASRTWDEVWFIARRIYMTPKEFKAKFGKAADKRDSASVSDQDHILPKGFAKGKVTVFEIWCKKTNKIYWVCKEMTNWSKEKDDFLELDDFYPCPKFLLATHTSDDFLPRPDYAMAKDQYEQLDELNTRIVILEKALRVVGVYDKKNAELKRILTDARENDMIPVEKWAVLAEAGGLKGQVDWFPIEMIATVLEKLTVEKATKLSEIYELTGISDIMRGATNPRETLGAQELKSQYSSVRLQYLQMEVAQFVREILIIKAQIICKHFQDETILKMSNIMETPDAQYAMQALQLLRDSQLTEYRVDINEEGLALPDYNQEKQTRIEFLTTVGQFLSQAAPITTAMPGALPYLVQIVRWVASGLRGSNEIQGILDQAINSLNQNPPQPPQQPPQDQSKIQVEQIKQQAETQRIPLKGKIDMQTNEHKANLELRNAIQTAKAQAAAKGQEQADDQVHEITVEQLKAANQKSHTVAESMLEIQHQNHAFEQARETQAADHEHQQHLQDTAPKPAKGK